MRKIVLLLLFCVPFAAFADGECSPHLFYISKSDNTNVLYYDARMSGKEIYGKDPVKIYWIMNEKKGQTETMTLLERPQFGILSKEVIPGKEYKLNIRNEQLSKKDLTMKLGDDGCVRVFATIDGEYAELNNVFIQIKPDSGLVPDVEYLDINGTTPDGKKVIERVIPSK